MRTAAVLVAASATLVAACATTYDPKETEAVRDYVVAAELEPVKQIRTNAQWGYSPLNDQFVIVTALRKDYLVEFTRRCIEIEQTLEPWRTGLQTDMVDYRRDSSLLRARFDTIRGCRIETMYPLSDEQVKELKNLGDAPGEEIFLPDEDD
jgi:hypothetical protein